MSLALRLVIDPRKGPSDAVIRELTRIRTL